MKKLLVVLAVSIAFLLSGCAGDLNMAIHIKTLEDLQNMKNDLTADYILDNDIDASATSGWNEGAGFEPVGDFTNKFTGSFDGQNYTISNLYINRPLAWPAPYGIALFGVVNTTKEIKNVTLKDCDITGWFAVGSLIGDVWPERLKISGITVTGNLTAQCEVGGLIGCATSPYGIEVSNCHTNVNITTWGNDDHVDIGGLIGDCVGDNYNIDKCSAVVKITIGDATNDEYASIGWIGGLLGAICDNCVISNSFAKGTIVAGNANDCIYDIAGFCASLGSNPNISNCYAQVDISVGNAGDALNLLAGFTTISRGTISNCYSTGSIIYGTYVRGGDWIGGFTGYDDGGVCSNCFWDTESSGMPESACGTGKTTAEMKTKSTFTGWDFDTIWGICEAPYIKTYPWLQWEAFECQMLDKEAPWKEDVIKPTGEVQVETPRRSGNWVTLEDVMRIHTSSGKDTSSPRAPIEIGQAEVLVSNISRNFNSFEEASNWYKNLEGNALQIKLGY